MNRTTDAAPSISRFAVIATLVLAGCDRVSQTVTAPEGGPVPSFAKVPPPTPVPIAVTVNDGAQYHVRSDGLGEYVNGQQTVSAQIDGAGNLQITVATSDTPARMLTFDYTAPTPSTTFSATATGARWFKIQSNHTNNNNPVIQDMNLNQPYCYNVYLSHGDGITQYQDYFNPAAYASATYATITRTSTTTWTMVTNPGCGGNADWAGIVTVDMTKSNHPRTFRGYWNLGFSITFRSL